MPDNATGTAVATQQRRNVLDQFREELAERAHEFRMALPSHISADKFQRTLVTAVQQNPALLRADRRSLVLACMKAAQSGLLPDGREAALVIFKNRKKINGEWKSVDEVAFIEMVYGVRKKILQARDADGKPVVSGLLVEAVYRKEVEAGHFIYEVGLDPPIRHRPMLDLTTEDADDRNIVGAYSIATMADGNKSYKFIRRFQIDKIRETSKTGATKNRDGTPRTPGGPWVEWFPAMCEKTVLKQHAKSLPQSGDLIVDTDDDDSYASQSAAALLSVPGGEPEAIEDHTDDTPNHDPETGEIIEGDANVTAADTSDERVDETAKAEPEKKPARSRGRQPAASGEGNANAASGSESSSDGAGAAKGEVSADTGTDEVGVTEHPAAAKADEILSKLAKAETIIDLDRVHREHDDDLQAMPDEYYNAVMGGYNRNRVRLGGQRVPVEQAEAAQ